MIYANTTTVIYDPVIVIRGILQLMRPANVATALADVLAGFAIAGLTNIQALPWLLGATACLYAGGVVLNDVFDREIDRVERPERPIPSGRVPVGLAAPLGFGLLTAGVALAAQGTRSAGAIAGAIAVFVLLYDAWGKRHDIVAPINMGLCRGLNLLLGVAAVPHMLAGAWPIAVIPLLYISAVTALSRGEVHGGSRRIGTLSLFVVSAALVALVALVSVAVRSDNQRLLALGVATVVIWRVIPAFWRARVRPEAATIRAAVRRGVLSLVLVDAAIGVAYGGPLYAAAILATGLLASWLARMFAVT